MHVAVVGCGYWGPNLVRNLVALPSCEKVTCCDLDVKKLNRLRQRFPDNKYTQSFDEVLGDASIEGVLIATSVSSHFSLAQKALKAGKHVFVEKPMTASVHESEQLIRLAETKNRILMVGHTFLFSPPVIKIKEIIQKGELGKIYYISASRVNLGLHQKDVSVIWDLAPHDFSILFYWLDEIPNKVWAIGRDCIVKGIPDVAFVAMEFPSGTQAHLQISWLAPSKLRRTAIVGSEKMLVYDDTENVEKVKIFDKGVNYKDPETYGEFQLSYRSGDIWSPRLDTYEPLQMEMESFLTAIKTGKIEKSTGSDGLKVVKVLEAAEKSLKDEGKQITIK
jgi:predicted dehydrogenase